MALPEKDDPLAFRHIQRSSVNLGLALDTQQALLQEISQKLSAILAMEPALARVANALEKIQNLERLAMKQKAQ